MHRSALGTIAWLGLSAALHLPVFSASVVFAETENLVLSGTVTALDTGLPVAGAIVLIQGANLRTVTDARGRYRFEGLAPGQHELVVLHLGREAARRAVGSVAGPMSADFQLPILSQQVVVTASGEEQSKNETPATVSTVGSEEIRSTRPTHPSELLGTVPGVWVNVTGGEGHQTAIRQPLTTNPVYLYLEDGVPTRSTGFFNHNALYEINLPMADSIEVLKGPGTALYGSDAIGGVVNVLTRPAPATPEVRVSAEGGSEDYGRMLLSAGGTFGNDGIRADLNLTRTDGWRDATGYDRQSATLRWNRFFGDQTTLKTVVAYSNIDQQTAGSSAISFEDYQADPTVNYTPISFRKVRALRVSTALEHLSGSTLFSVTPFFRFNEMDILPNWTLTFDPSVWYTENWSVGLLAKLRHDFQPLRTRVLLGIDLDHSPGSRLEDAITAKREGKVFTEYTEGDRLYDYDVTFREAAPFVQVETSPTERLRVTGGLRLDLVGYNYENHLDVVTTGRYRRPASTEVNKSHLSPKLGLTYSFAPAFNAFAAYAHAFRVPSESQLFRQGQAVDTVGLEPVKVDSFEVGLRGQLGQHASYEVSAYSMTKTDDILSYRRADGSTETLNAGETLHRGLEIGLGAKLDEGLSADLAFTVAKHTYEEWEPQVGVNLAGNELETAPRILLNARLAYNPAFLSKANVSLEWVHLGSYWMDAANTHEYGGHDLLNLRLGYEVSQTWGLFGRVLNLTDRRYAESATFNAARGEEFAPGNPLSIYAGFEFLWR